MKKSQTLHATRQATQSGCAWRCLKRVAMEFLQHLLGWSGHWLSVLSSSLKLRRVSLHQWWLATLMRLTYISRDGLYMESVLDIVGTG